MRRITVAVVGFLALFLAFAMALVLAGPAARAAVSPAQVPTPGLRWLVVRTTPVLPNVQFLFAGSPLTADALGEARVLITNAQLDAFRANRDAMLQPAASVFEVRAGVRARFAGWGNSTYHYSATDKTGDVENASFDLEYLTKFSFTNPEGRAVPASKIQSLELRSSTGGTIDAAPDTAVWLPGDRVVAGTEGFEARDTHYKFIKVMMAGSNVVHEAQQQFVPSRDQTPVVKLLFYSATFSARDVIFGQKIGSGIDLEYPDGHVRHVEFQQGHTVRVDDLPRGQYSVTAKAAAFRVSQSTTLSKDQNVDLQVITYYDIAVVAVFLGAIVALVLVVGHRMRRRARGVTEEPSPVPDERDLVIQGADPERG